MLHWYTSIALFQKCIELSVLPKLETKHESGLTVEAMSKVLPNSSKNLLKSSAKLMEYS